VDCIAQNYQCCGFHAQTVQQTVFAENLEEIVHLSVQVADNNGGGTWRNLYESAGIAILIKGTEDFFLLYPVDIFDGSKSIVGGKRNDCLTVDSLDLE
jgi:hypothetical protein